MTIQLSRFSGRSAETAVDDGLPHGLSSYRRLTAWLRPAPDFLVIGAQRSGSTSMYHNLIQHPCVVPAFRKEVHFFDRHYAKGLGWYRGHFPIWLKLKSSALLCRQPRITGEATPAYLFHPHAPRRVHQLLPGIKLIALLRNPIDRAYSQYQMNIEHRWEPLSFDEATRNEVERTAADLQRQQHDEFYFGPAHRRWSYLQRGIYVEQLQRWLQYVERSRLLILDSRAFSANPRAVLEQVAAFLDLPPGGFGSYTSHHVGRYAAMEPRTRSRLAEYFKPYNQRLYEFLGQDFGWD